MSFISEKKAAEIVGRKPRTLRRNVKSGKWKVDHVTLNRRTYKYEERDLLKLFTRVILKTA